MTGLFLIPIILGIFYLIYTALRQASQLNYIQNFSFHPGLRQKLKNRHPGLSDAQLDLVFQGLRDYFYICNKAKRRMVSMPSQVVDDAWHEFILFTRNYQLFCRKALGRFLHHTPAEAMRSPTLAQDGIKWAWRLACRKEHINPKIPLRLPLLFAIDAQLDITGGFVYSLDCRAAQDNSFCAGHIGCGSSCGGGDGCGGDGGCAGGCGGD